MVVELEVGAKVYRLGTPISIARVFDCFPSKIAEGERDELLRPLIVLSDLT